MNDAFGRASKTLVLVFFFCASLAAGGCEGTDTRGKVDDTVEEMAGKRTWTATKR
jgi:hypothetical protein